MKYLLPLFFIFFISCSSSKHAVYEVSPNDVADIDLILQKNKKFLIHFKDFEEKPPKTYTFKGKWSEKGDNIRLEFKLDKNDAPDLYALFDPSLDENRTVKVIDKKTIEFKKGAKKIKIWGISVEKSTDKK